MSIVEVVEKFVKMWYNTFACERQIGIDRALRARDASCPKGKKMEVRKSLTTRNLKER